MEIKRAIEFDESIRNKIAELYVEGFYEDGLKHFSKDKSKIVKAYTPMLPIEYFFVAVIDNEIAGITACLGKGNVCLNLNKIFQIIFLIGVFWHCQLTPAS